MGTQVLSQFCTLPMNTLQSGGPGFTRVFKNGENRFTILGIVSGSLNSLKCGGELPDYYTYVGNQEILGWIQMAYTDAQNKLSRFNFIDDPTVEVRCKEDAECPPSYFCSEGFCYERSTVSSSRRRSMKPNPACPEDTPCKGRGEQECRRETCNRLGDSCWCETRRRGKRNATESLDDEKNTDYVFVEGDPHLWNITCGSSDDCPNLWYCAEEVCLETNHNVF